MNWFYILKVDIDFDKDIDAMGQYQEGPDFENEQEFHNFLNKLLMNAAFMGKNPTVKDLVKEKIKINHHRISEYLEEKLGRKPTDKELIRYITRVIMHEGTHAAMGEEQDSMATHQAEYGAYTGQFPESTYIRLKEYIKHPATKRVLFPPELAMMLGVKPEEVMRTPDIIKKVEELLGYIDGITEDMEESVNKETIKEKLTRLEIKARQEGKPLVRDWPKMSNEEFYNFSLKRYGSENKDLIDEVARINGIDSSEFKMAVAVTTTSSPSMFNNKAIRRRKKRRDD